MDVGQLAVLVMDNHPSITRLMQADREYAALVMKSY